MSRHSLAALCLLMAGMLGLALWTARHSPASVPPTLQTRPTAAAKSPLATTLPQTPLIRVSVTEGSPSVINLEITEPFRIQPVGSNRVLHESPTKLGKTTVTSTPRGLKIGTIDLPVSRVEIIPRNSPAVWVNDHQYRGSMRLYRQSGGSLAAVNVLPLEEYIACVIDSEMPTEFGPEARAAQAIVARTYALYQIRTAASDDFSDLFASTRSQKYLGYQYRDGNGRLLAGESGDSRRLAAETQGMVCLYNGQLFCTYYSAACGGHTLLGTELFPDAAPPLRSVPCDWCRDARLYRWNCEVSRSDMQSELKPVVTAQGGTLGTLKSVKPAGTPVTGKLPQFEIRDDRRSYRASGADLRRVLSDRSVYSPNFSIEDRGNTFAISGKGHGHGVGLCQWGARGQDHAGKMRMQILAHYYPGAKVVVVDYR